MLKEVYVVMTLGVYVVVETFVFKGMWRLGIHQVGIVSLDGRILYVFDVPMLCYCYSLLVW